MRNFIIVLAVLLISLPAMATEPTTPSAAASAATTEEAPQKQPPQISPGHTAINDEMAKAYYDSCMGKRDQRMSNEAQDSLCECTSIKMQGTMSVEDIRAMGQNDQAGRDMLNKMLLDVYSPCMSVPLNEMLKDQCMMDGNVREKGMHKIDLCECMADKTAAWFTTNGRNMMAEVLAVTPNISDPLSPVMNSERFRAESMNNIVSCLPAKKSRK